MDAKQKAQLTEGCRRLQKEIGAWFVMGLWVICSVKGAQWLWGERLPSWATVGGMVLCGVFAIAAHLDNPLRHGYKLRRPKRYLAGSLIWGIAAIWIVICQVTWMQHLQVIAVPLVFIWNPICVWLEWNEALRQAQADEANGGNG